MPAPDPPAGPPGLLPKPRTAVLIVAGAAGMALLSFWYRYLDLLARGGEEPFQIRLIEEFTGVFGAVALLVPVVWLTRWMDWRRVPWHRAVLLHVPAFGAFAVLHTALLWGSRSLIFPLAGLGTYDYGVMPLRFLMELGIQVPVYLIAVGATLAVEHRRTSRARELRIARLEGELASARLANLEHQLRPHFLFNALNTVSSVMYDDRDRADRILNDLGRLLRRSLRTPEAQLVPLEEELENLELFLGIARARFEERLDACVTAEDAALGATVPALLLQPLVENALQHGDPGEGATAVVRVHAGVRGDRLSILVTDNGPGGGGRRGRPGIGLGNTQRRLQLLHPGNHHFDYGNGAGGGFEVRIDLPLQPSPAAADA